MSPYFVVIAIYGWLQVWVLLVREHLTHNFYPAVKAISWWDNYFAYLLHSIFIMICVYVSEICYDGDEHDDDDDMLSTLLAYAYVHSWW